MANLGDSRAVICRGGEAGSNYHGNRGKRCLDKSVLGLFWNEPAGHHTIFLTFFHPAWHEQSSKHSVDCYPETSFHSGKTFLMIVAKHMCRLDTFVADPGGLVMQFFLMQASID